MKIGIALFYLQQPTFQAKTDGLDFRVDREQEYLHNIALYYDKSTQEKHIVDNFNVANLPSDVLWLSNLPRDDLWLNGYLITHNIKDDMFFNISFQAIRNLITSPLDPIEDVLSKMLFVFEKLISMALVVCNANFDNHVNSYKYGMAYAPNKVKTQHEYDDLLKELLPSAYQPIVRGMSETTMFALRESHPLTVVLKRNGISYVEKILQDVCMPTVDAYKNYQVLKGHELIDEMKALTASLNKEYRSVQSSLLDLEFPFLVNVGKRQIAPVHSDREDFFSSTWSTRTLSEHLERTWFTSDEFKVMAKFFNYPIRQVLVFNKIDNKNIIADYELEIPNVTNVSYFSLISNIFMENLLLSLTIPMRETWELDLFSIFVLGQEKREMMTMSLLLDELGYKILQYGYNQIHVAVSDRHELNRLSDLAQTYGYLVL